MEYVEVEKSTQLTDGELLLQAGNMADWFVPFLYGVDIEPGEISVLAKERLTNIVGTVEIGEQMQRMKTIVSQLPDEHKNNAVLYCSGYPKDALSVLAEGDVTVTIELLSAGEARKNQDDITIVDTVIQAPFRHKPGRPARDFRSELQEKGISSEQAKERLNAHVSKTHATMRGRALLRATQFMQWYESTESVSTLAHSSGVTVPGFMASIKRLVDVVSDESLDSVTPEEDDVVGAALADPSILTPKQKQPRRQKTVKAEVLTQTNTSENNTTLDLEWQEDALCAQTDPEAFFPEKGGSTRMAKKICIECDVRVQCLEYALDSDERFGIWGGKSERERRQLKKLNKKSA